MNKICGSIIIYLIIFNISYANNEVKSYLTNNTVSYGDVTQLVIRVKTSDEDVERVILPPLKGLTIINKSTSMSTNITYINGKFTRTTIKQFIYSLKVITDHDIIIPSINVIIKNKTYKTNPLTLQVIKGTHASKSKTSSQPTFPTQVNTNTSGKKEIYLDIDVNEKNPFAGEGILVHLYLYSQYTVSNIYYYTPLQGKNVFIYDIDSLFYKNSTLKKTEILLNNNKYLRYDLGRYYVFPISPGAFSLGNAEIEAEITTRDNFFGFFSTTSKKELKLSTRNFVCLNLPSYDTIPFNGAIGKFEVRLSSKKDSLSPGEMTELSFIIKGEGNFPLISAPELIINGLEIQEPEEVMHISLKKNKLVGEKIFKYPITPDSSGIFTIPGIKFYYFDREKKEFLLAKTNETKIFSIRKNITANHNKKTKTYIKPAFNFSYINNKFYYNKELLILLDKISMYILYFSISFFVAVFIGKFLLKFFLKTPSFEKRNRLKKIIEVNKKSFLQALQSKKIDDAAANLNRLITEFLIEKYDSESLSRDLLIKKFNKEYKQGKKLTRISKEIDMIAYSNVYTDNVKLKDIFKETLKILKEAI